MYEDKIKEELFGKIYELFKTRKEMTEMEHNSNLPESELYATDEWQGLMDQSMELLVDAQELMVETKYIPLTGLPIELMKELDYLAELSDADIDNYIEKHLDARLLHLKEEMMERIAQVKALRLTAHLDPHTGHVYNEVIRCFIYGLFDASCVLCRAIVELMAKKFIEHKGYSHLLVGKNKHLKKVSIQEILDQDPLMPAGITKRYSQITNKANNILHKKNKGTEEKEALEIIRLLQSFIKDFPSTK